MDRSMQEMVTQNIDLKKAIALSKVAIDRTQYEYSFLKESYEELDHRYNSLKGQNQLLQRTHQNLQRKSLDDERYLEQRVSQLKDIVEEKQRQIEEIQIKILPSLDQDMIRIKVINEVEEPFQEKIHKSNQEIDLLKKVVYENQKRATLLRLELEECRINYEKDIDGLRLDHLGQIKVVNGSLGQIVQWNQSKERDKQTIRTLRRNVEDSRNKMELTLNQMDEVRKDNQVLRTERNELLIRFTSIDNNDKGIRNKLELELHDLKNKLKVKDMDVEKLDHDIEKLKSEGRILKSKKIEAQEQLERTVKELDSAKALGSNQLKELERAKQEIEQLEIRLETQEQINKEYKKQHDLRLEELSELEEKIKRASHSADQKETNYKEEMEQFNDNRIKRVRQQLEEAQGTIQLLRDQNTRLKKELTSHIDHKENTRDPQTHDSQFKAKIQQLEGKLKQSNQTIVILLKEKAKSNKIQSKNISTREFPKKDYNPRSRDHSPQLEGDAGLVPLVPLPLIPFRLTRDIYIPTRF